MPQSTGTMLRILERQSSTTSCQDYNLRENHAATSTMDRCYRNTNGHIRKTLYAFFPYFHTSSIFFFQRTPTKTPARQHEYRRVREMLGAMKIPSFDDLDALRIESGGTVPQRINILYDACMLLNQGYLPIRQQLSDLSSVFRDGVTGKVYQAAIDVIFLGHVTSIGVTANWCRLLYFLI
jgi:hypothetical protein